MIIKTHSKNKSRSVLILIELFIAFFSVNIGLGVLNSSLKHISSVKLLMDSNVINVLPIKNYNPTNISEREKKDLSNFYIDIKTDNRISMIGSYTDGYICNETLDKPDSRYTYINVVGIDSNLINMFNLNGIKIKENDNPSIIHAIIGRNVAKVFASGSSIPINLFKQLNTKVVASYEIKDKTYFLNSGSRGFISDSLRDTDNLIVIPLSKESTPIFLNSMDKNILIKLKDNINKDDFIKFINDKFKQYNIDGSVHDIKEEFKEYMNQNSYSSGFLILFSILLFFLASIGLVGVNLLSIAKRKIEVGIRYALGSTQRDITKLIVGEITVLFIIGNIMGTISALLVSCIIKEIKIDIFTFTIATLFMLIFCCVSSIPVITRFMKINLIDMKD